MDNRFRDILNELSFFHRNKDSLLEQYIQQRLDESFNTYKKELDNSLRYLENRKVQINVMQKMNRGKKK